MLHLFFFIYSHERRMAKNTNDIWCVQKLVCVLQRKHFIKERICIEIKTKQKKKLRWVGFNDLAWSWLTVNSIENEHIQRREEYCAQNTNAENERICRKTRSTTKQTTLHVHFSFKTVSVIHRYSFLSPFSSPLHLVFVRI